MILAQSACFWIRSVRPKPDLTQSTRTQIGPGLVLHSNYDPGRLWQTAAESLKVGRWKRAGCVLPEPGPMILAHRLASGPDAFGQNLTRPSRLDLGQLYTI